MIGNKIIKILVPLAAIVIIFESVLLITKSVKKPDLQSQRQESGVVLLDWTAAGNTKMGVSEDVILTMKAKQDVALDAIDLYIKYDPTRVTVSELGFDVKMEKPSFNKISQEQGLVVINYLISAANGMKLKAGEAVDLARLKVNYVADGKTGFEIDPKTLVVENATAKVLPFNSESLEVNVTQ